MNIITSINAASRIKSRVVLSIGNFDGLHRAHARILKWTVREARRIGGEAWVLTFSNHPVEILERIKPRLLATREEKLERLERMGLDGVLLVKFTKSFSRLSGREFIGRLCGLMKIAAVCVGDNFLFGSVNKGDTALLAGAGRELGFRLKTFPVLRNGRSGIISSSAIRRLVGLGRVDEARRLLGRPYSITMKVVRGKKLGRKIGIPTLNFDPAEPSKASKLIPADGVYRTETVLSGGDGGVRKGLTYVGPSFGKKRKTIETHLSRFSGNAYGRTAEVRFLEFLRKPRTFRTLTALESGIRRDIRTESTKTGRRRIARTRGARTRGRG